MHLSILVSSCLKIGKNDIFHLEGLVPDICHPDLEKYKLENLQVNFEPLKGTLGSKSVLMVKFCCPKLIMKLFFEKIILLTKT